MEKNKSTTGKEKNDTANGDCNKTTGNDAWRNQRNPDDDKKMDRKGQNDTKCVSEDSLYVPVPPDGGWGWVVAFSSFMVGVLVDGICFTFGFFYLHFMDHFDANNSVTASISSVLNGSYMTMGPLVGALVNIFGCRRVTIAGSILSSLAFFLCTFSPNIQTMIVLYGFLGGVGFGLMYLPAIVMVGYYFEKKRALATGIAVCGSGIGSFVFAPLCEFLLQHYDWKGAMWVISAIVLNGTACGALYRPLDMSPRKPKRKSNSTDKEDPSEGIKSQSGSNPNDGPAVIAFELTDEMGHKIPCFKTAAEELKMNETKPIYRCRSMDLPTKPAGKSCPEQYDLARLAFSQTILSDSSRHESSPHHKHALPPLLRKDILYGGSVTRLPEYKKAGTEEKFLRSMMDVRSQHETEQEEDDETKCVSKVSLRKIWAGMFDFSLLRSPTFVIYLFSCFLCMMGFFIPFNYIPALAREFGMSSSQGAWVISIIGIINTVGRLLVGYISDKDWADCLVINNVSLVIGGVVTVFVSFYRVYAVLAIYGLIFGFSIAAFVSLRSIIIVELLGIDKLTNSFGLVVLAQGLSSFIGSPIAGALSDATGDYKASFYLAGISIAMSGIICFPLRRISAWEKSFMAARKSNKGAELSPMLEPAGEVTVAVNGAQTSPDSGVGV